MGHLRALREMSFFIFLALMCIVTNYKRQFLDGGLKLLFPRSVIKIFVYSLSPASHIFHKIPVTTFLSTLKLCCRAGSTPMHIKLKTILGYQNTMLGT